MIVALPVDAGRKGRLDYLSQGGEIVIGDPAEKIEYPLIEKGYLVEAIDNCLHILARDIRGEMRG